MKGYTIKSNVIRVFAISFLLLFAGARGQRQRRFIREKTGESLGRESVTSALGASLAGS